MPQRPTGKRRPVAPPGPGDEAIKDEGATEEAVPVEDASVSVAEAAPAVEDDTAPEDETDGRYGAAEPEGSADLFPPKPVSARREAWRKRSATGAILTGFALGLQQVFEPETKEPAIVMETSGDPPRDLPVEAELELATSRRSVVRIRPWLLDDAEPGAAASGSGATDGPDDEGDA